MGFVPPRLIVPKQSTLSLLKQEHPMQEKWNQVAAHQTTNEQTGQAREGQIPRGPRADPSIISEVWK